MRRPRGRPRRPGVLPRRWDDAARALLPLVLIVLAAWFRELRIPVLVVLVAGYLVAVRRDAAVRYVYAGAIPVAVFITWRLITAPLADPDGLECADALSPPAVWRLAQATLGIGIAALLLVRLGVSPRQVWFTRPSVGIARLSVLGFFVAGPLGLVLAALLARPYFGTFSLDLTQPAALVPGMVFSLSNGIAEEVLYRGVFMALAARVVGLGPALVIQAIVFGLAHGGAHFLGSPIPVVAVVGFGGIVAGLIVVRTGSLMLPIAVHVAVDLPVYAFFACRNPVPL